MLTNLPCFNHASHQLKRHCGGSRCGPYKELEVSLLGFGHRCRTLVCDLSCTRAVLMRECGSPTGIRAFRFLLDYTRIQVRFPLILKNVKISLFRNIVKSISRTFLSFLPHSISSRELPIQELDVQRAQKRFSKKQVKESYQKTRL